MKKTELELKDWKEAEHHAIVQIRQGLIMVEVGEAVKDFAESKIIRLGGLSEADERKRDAKIAG